MSPTLLRRFAPPILILGGINCWGAVVIAPAYNSSISHARRSTCLSSLKGVALACRMYAEDNDNQFPPLSLENEGWAEIIYRNINIVPELSCPEGERVKRPSSDYFYNARLAQIPTSKLKYPMSTIAFGDGMDNGPTNSHLLEVPTYKFRDFSSFMARHDEGANYAFADGHIKWMHTKIVNLNSSFDPAQKPKLP